MSETSTQKLVRVLKEQNDPRLTHIIKNAENDYYNDYKSSLACPIVQLVDDLRMWRREDLAQRAINGEFDGTKEEAEEWANSPEGQATFQEFFEWKDDS